MLVDYFLEDCVQMLSFTPPPVEKKKKRERDEEEDPEFTEVGVRACVRVCEGLRVCARGVCE